MGASDARRFSEQSVYILPPVMDDRLRTLAQKHGVSLAKATRVALMSGLRGAEMLDTAAFLRVHNECETEAIRRHLDCSGGWHSEDR